MISLHSAQLREGVTEELLALGAPVGESAALVNVAAASMFPPVRNTFKVELDPPVTYINP